MAYSRWRPLFLEAIDEALYPASWLDKRVSEGSAHLLESDDAACLLEIKFYPSGVRELHCLVAAGNPQAIKALAPEAETIGRANGAVLSAIESSPAWARIMKDAGYHVEQVRIAKRL